MAHVAILLAADDVFANLAVDVGPFQSERKYVFEKLTRFNAQHKAQFPSEAHADLQARNSCIKYPRLSHSSLPGPANESLVERCKADARSLLAKFSACAKSRPLADRAKALATEHSSSICTFGSPTRFSSASRTLSEGYWRTFFRTQLASSNTVRRLRANRPA